MDSISVQDIIEEVKVEICDHYCKYPLMDIPEGEEEGWLCNSDNSPCIDCPLGRL